MLNDLHLATWRYMPTPNLVCYAVENLHDDGGLLIRQKRSGAHGRGRDVGFAYLDNSLVLAGAPDAAHEIGELVIYPKYRRCGIATGFLLEFLSGCLVHREDVVATPGIFQGIPRPDGFTHDDLVKWYTSFGFKSHGGAILRWDVRCTACRRIFLKKLNNSQKALSNKW